MSEPRRSNRVRVVLAIVVGVLLLAILVCSIVVFGFPVGRSAARTARERWEARPFDEYRMVMRIDALTQCDVETHVVDETVVAVTSNDPGCEQEFAVSVTDLFNRLDTMDPRACGPNGCACDGPIGADVDYHPTLGYPTRLEIRLQPERRWTYPEYWSKQVGAGSCTLIGFIGTTIEITSLTPEP